ncbi:hypothetical protein [Vibrio sp. 10N]|uniref:hypothetical protein n=1 Tax=Vibrio sp. 10N TaxID=3058938 RepID=UPI0030C6A69A
MIDFSSNMTTMDRARLLEMNFDHPEDLVFGKLLVELGNQSAERVRSSAMKVELSTLKVLAEALQEQIALIKKERAEEIACMMRNDGFTVDDVLSWRKSQL